MELCFPFSRLLVRIEYLAAANQGLQIADFFRVSNGYEPQFPGSLSILSVREEKYNTFLSVRKRVILELNDSREIKRRPEEHAHLSSV